MSSYIMHKNLYFDYDTLDHLGKDARIDLAVRIRHPELCSVGDYCIIDDFTYISCALFMGLFSHISANCTLLGGGGKIFIGNFVDIAPGCQLISASQDYVSGGLSGPCIPDKYKGSSIVRDVSLGDYVLLGSQTVVLPGAILPEGMATGAMTIVRADVEYEPWTVYIGQPARALKLRAMNDIVMAASKLLEDIYDK